MGPRPHDGRTGVACESVNGWPSVARSRVSGSILRRTRTVAARSSGVTGSRAIDWRSATSRGWLGCRVKPLRLGDAVGLGESDAFFRGAGVQVVSITAVACSD